MLMVLAKEILGDVVEVVALEILKVMFMWPSLIFMAPGLA
ncbi:hypothetical protein Taro_035345, partial [Colocasia esculenta]|nr:hypothetical protein [Colocasia esculenta]